MSNQHTLKSSLSLCGRGLHTGREAVVTIHPAVPFHGLKFSRVDMEGSPMIPADAMFVVETERSTTLGVEGATMSTGEHLLAALYGLGVDNALIEVNQPEIPILDGSAKPWVNAILETGIIEQAAKREIFSIKEPIYYSDPENGIEAEIRPSDSFRLRVSIDYSSSVLPKQTSELEDFKLFSTEFAPARTFVFLHEIEALLKHNLIKGGDIDNAIVFVERMLEEDQIEHLARIFKKDPKEIKVKKGILNNIEPTFVNEPARHKLVDLLGDLSLVGVYFKGDVFVKKPGHRVNVSLAKLIKKQIL